MNLIEKALSALHDVWLSIQLTVARVGADEQKILLLLEKLVALRLRYLGQKTDATAYAMVELACAIAQVTQDYARSERMLREAQRTFVRLHRKWHIGVAWSIFCRAWLRELREFPADRVIWLYVASHNIYDRVDPWSVNHARVLTQLAAFMRRVGQKDEAQPYENQAEKILLMHGSISAPELYMGR